jgi:hypothetical protein
MSSSEMLCRQRVRRSSAGGVDNNVKDLSENTSNKTIVLAQKLRFLWIDN